MEEAWKAKEIENMIEENKEDGDMKYLNKHSHFNPYGFTVLKKPFKYMRINTVLRCLKKYSGLSLEIGFIQKRNKGRTEVPEDGTEAEDDDGEENEVEKSDDGDDADRDENDVEPESEEDEVEKSDDEDEEDQVESEDDERSSSEDEVCKSVKRMKFKRSGETSDGSSDTDEDSGNEKFERMRKEFRSKTTSSNVCPKCKKKFSNRSNLGKHYTRCLTKTD
jgi:hypothetical protein